MLKAVTFQGFSNFKANLYALEVKSRFKNLPANGYYKGYGDELSATVISTTGIRIGSGALLVQGRMIEVVSNETASVAFENGKVGYVVMHIETCPADSANTLSLVTYTASTFSGISLTKQNVYATDAESVNKIYELPLYSFVMQNGAISSVTKLISAIDDVSIKYMHRIFIKLQSGNEIYFDFITKSPTASSTFGALWDALDDYQVNNGGTWVKTMCNGADGFNGSNYYSINATTEDGDPALYVEDTDGGDVYYGESDIRDLRDTVIEL